MPGILLSLPPQHWNYRRAIPCLAFYMGATDQTQVSCSCGKPFTDEAISPGWSFRMHRLPTDHLDWGAGREIDHTTFTALDGNSSPVWSPPVSQPVRKMQSPFQGSITCPHFQPLVKCKHSPSQNKMDNRPQVCNDNIRLERDQEGSDNSLSRHCISLQINVASPAWPYACTWRPGLMPTLVSGTYFMGLNSACP